MPCDKLKQLRSEATALKLQIKDQSSKARSAKTNNRRTGPRSSSDLSMFLQRKLARTAQRIEQHLSEHQCQK